MRQQVKIESGIFFLSTWQDSKQVVALMQFSNTEDIFKNKGKKNLLVYGIQATSVTTAKLHNPTFRKRPILITFSFSFRH